MEVIKEIEKSGCMLVTSEQSYILQMHLFEKGYRWWTDRAGIVKYTDKPKIYWDSYDMGLSWSDYQTVHTKENTLHKFEEHFNHLK